MISTSTMIQLQRVKGNKMVDMQLSNNKLVKRGIEMLMEMGGLNREQAQGLLERHGSVRAALNAVK
jgi:N-acetylmuramic acid 6-phosphate etherase